MYSFGKMFTCLLRSDCYNITVLQFLKSKNDGFVAFLPVKNHKKLSNEPQKTFLKTVKL